MGNEDLYAGDVRNYYNTQRIIVRADEHPGLICSSSIPDGKTQRRERRAKAIRRRKGRLCNSCLYQFDTRHCCVPDFREVVQCNGYVDKKDFYKHSSKRKGYVIPYNFPLNTRRGFRTIYYLMRLSQHDMSTVIKDIIAVRHDCINFIRNVCDKLEKDDDYTLQYLLRGG